MKFMELAKHLKNENIDQVFLLTGEEHYLIEYSKQMIKKRFITDDEYDDISIDGKNKIEIILKNLETFPLFSNKKVIVVKDSGLFKTGDLGRLFDEFMDSISNPDKDTVLVFIEEKVDKRSKLYKFVKKKYKIVECDKQDDKELAKWASKVFRSEKKKISSSDAIYFVSLTERDMNGMLQEIKKICAYLGDDQIVTRELLNELVTKSIHDSIFDLIDSIAQGNEKEAYELLQNMLFQKEPEQKILFLVTNRFIDMLYLKKALRQSGNITTAAKLANIRFVWLAKKLNSAASRFDEKRLKKVLDACVLADEQIKNGIMNPRLALETLIAKIV